MRSGRGLVLGALVFIFTGLTAPPALAQAVTPPPAPTATASALPREGPPEPRPNPAPAGSEVARVRPGHVVRVHARPAGPIVATLDAVTEFGSSQTFGVVTRRGHWLGVTTSSLPNDRLGWLRDNRSLRVTRTSVKLVLDLSRRLLVLQRGDRVLRKMTVGVGRSSSPTPKGRFAVTDKLPGARYGPYYGCCIIALSAHQPNLPVGWRGGDRIAIHGTTDLGSIGAAASAGCPRARDSDLRVLARFVPIGAPVIVRG
jgi:lipoprotein-anchoring transpeptidase ErfK/SrfK